MSGARLLLIEDSLSLAALLYRQLGNSGYQVTTAHTGVAGLTLARSQAFDLILLDLGLPDFDGADIVVRLRTSARVPIVCLTARGAIEEKVRLLGLGADDYLVKPVHTDELLARIAAHLRRTLRRGDTLQVGALQADLEQQLVRYEGQDLPLSGTEFALLVTLMRQGGRLIGREVLHQAVWGSAPPAGSTLLDTHLANIRAKLRRLGAEQVIRTVRGVGFALREQIDSGAPDP